MFNSKQKQLFSVKEKQKGTSAKTTSVFVKAAKKKGAETLSGNGALKYSSTGDAFVDQFGKIGTYKVQRPFGEIEKDCEALWAVDPLKCIKMIIYIRMITRQTDYFYQGDSPKRTSEPQKGAEMRHEGIMRMIWLSTKSKTAFANNLHILVAAGSWKDLIQMLQYDLMYHGWEDKVLPWDFIGNLILGGLSLPATSEMVKKYLPQIKVSSKCTTIEAQADTMIAKWICSQLFGKKSENDHSGYKKYRKLKSSGTAHEWQKLISQKKMDRLEFDKVHGRALSLLVRSKFLKNQGLTEKYAAWAKKPETKIKFTGFVHELFAELGANGEGYTTIAKYPNLYSIPQHLRDTINKQFTTLVEKAKSDEKQTPFIVVRDTSGSMSSIATGTNMTCYAIGKALALYFSEFLEGKFANAWIEFNTKAQMHEWQGSTPIEKWFNDRSNFYGSTNFQSVVELFCKLKKQGVPESEFPKGILCISDGEFNPLDLGETNVEAARRSLREAKFSQDYVENFVIVLWNLQSKFYGKRTGEKFETFGDVNNVYYFSGYSASIISFLTSKVKTAAELVDAALDQEILRLVQL